MAGLGAARAANTAAAMEAFRNNPQMAQLRQLVHENPEIIQPLIQQIVANNPVAAQALNQNPELLFQLLGEGLEGEDFGGEAGEGAGGLPPGAIAITPEDDAAIQRVS
jgi:UV excision repair protein RAD23